MDTKKYSITALLNSKFKLEDYIFKCNNRRKPQDFSRERKMGFKETMLFMLNMVKKIITNRT